MENPRESQLRVMTIRPKQYQEAGEENTRDLALGMLFEPLDPVIPDLIFSFTRESNNSFFA